MASIADFLLIELDEQFDELMHVNISEHEILKIKLNYMLNNRTMYKNNEILDNLKFRNELLACKHKLDIINLIKKFFDEKKTCSYLIHHNICMQISGRITEVGDKIAKTMLRVAATRIFADPEQSIMELPVNSIDSYNSENTIGKFGMGFQSLLYWICEAKDGKYERTIRIDSVYRDEGVKKTFGCDLIWTEMGLKITVSSNGRTDRKCGTRIRLKCSTFHLDNQNIEKIIKYLNRLEFITNATVVVNGVIINSGKNVHGKVVDISVNESEISVNDQAKGIPFEIFEKHMLVPSSSTKIRSLQTFKFIPENVSKCLNYDRLCLIVSGVCVIDVKIESIGNYGDCYEIYLPRNSKIPVSRDDIIFERDSQELHHFKTAVENIIVNLITESRKSINPIITLLKKYVKINKSPYLSEVVYEIINQIKRFPYMFVPDNEFWRSFSKISKITEDIVLYDNSLIFDAEEKFIKIIDRFEHSDLIFKSRFVVALNEDYKHYRVGEGSGFSSVVFTKTLNRNDINRSIFLNSNTILIPVKSGQEPSSMDITNPRFKQKIDVIFMTYKKKLITIKGTIHLMHLESLINDYSKIFSDDEDFFELFLMMLSSKIAEAKIVPIYEAVFTYGGQIGFYGGNWEYSPITTVHNLSDNSLLRMNTIDRKLAEFFIDCYPTHFENKYIIPNITEFICIYKDSRLIEEFYLIENYAPGKGELYLLNLILREIDRGFMLHSLYEKISGICLFILSEIRKVIDNTTLEEIIHRYYVSGNSSLSINISARIITPTISSTESFLRFKNTKLADSIIRNEETDFLFSCKALIRHSFFNDRIDFIKLSNEYQENKNIDLGIQILEIAVNEGTTKGFIQSIMTELVQNSLDAIRSGITSRNDIEIIVGVNYISVKDYVGISDIVQILIPFLSSKNPNDPNVTGEMGTGFFNVYRQPYVEYVTIETVYNGKHFMIKGTPQSNESGYVTDILYNLMELDSIEESSTQITIFIKNDIEMISSLMVEAQLYVDNQLSFIKDAQIFMNGTVISITSESVLFDENIGEIRFSEDKIFPSFILTNDVPFCKLTDLDILNDELLELIEKYGLNYLTINFFKTCYTPTQSRTKINFDVNKIARIRNFIKNGIIIYTFNRYISNKVDNPNSIIENTTSSSDFDQVLPNPELNEFTRFRFNERYMTLRTNLSIGEILQEILKMILRRELMSFGDLPRNTLQEKIIYHWIKYKNLRIKESKDNKMCSIITNEKREPLKIMSRELSAFCEIYWKILEQMIKNKQLRGVTLETPPIVYYEELEDDEIQGFYSPLTNCISLNIKYFNNDKFLKSIMQASDEEGFDISTIITDECLIDYFSTSEPVCIFIHEVTHAILGDQHEKKCIKCEHSQTYITIDNIINPGFYDACLKIYIFAASNYNLFDDYYDMLSIGKEIT